MFHVVLAVPSTTATGRAGSFHPPICAEGSTKRALEWNETWNNFSDLKMMYGLCASTEDTFTRLALGYVCMLVKTNFQNKAGKKGFNFIFGALLPKKI